MPSPLEGLKKASTLTNNDSWIDRLSQFVSGDEGRGQEDVGPYHPPSWVNKAMTALDQLTYGNFGPESGVSLGMMPTGPTKGGSGLSNPFTKPMYHATRSATDFTEFGSPIAKATGDFGIHVTPSTETASRINYLGPFGSTPEYPRSSRIMPLMVKADKTLDLPDMGMWKSPNHWIGSLADSEMADKVGRSPRISPNAPTNDLETTQQLYQHALDYRPDFNFPHDQRFIDFQQNLLDTLQKRGYDSIKYANKAEGMGEDSYLLLDPRQIRSKYAKLDPAKFGKTKDIMASAAPLVGLAAAEQMRGK